MATPDSEPSTMKPCLQSLIQQRQDIKEESRTLRIKRPHSEEAVNRLRLLRHRLLRLKSRVYYHRHRLSKQKRLTKYHHRRCRYLARRLRVFQNLPQEQLVNLSTTAGQMCDRIEAKLGIQQRKFAELAASTTHESTVK